MDKKETQKDTAYSWVLVIVCSLAYMLIVGNIKAFSVLYTELLEHFGERSETTAWVVTITLFLTLILSPLANHLCVVFTFRKVMMTGGILVSSGFLMTSFMPNLKLMYLTFGLVTGIGYGLLFSPCVTVINYYTHKWRGLANGLIFSGSGTGSFLFPFFYRFLIRTYGFRGAILLLSSILLHLCVAGSAVRQPLEMSKVRDMTKHSLTNNIDTEDDDLIGNTDSSSRNRTDNKESNNLFEIPKRRFACNLKHSLLDLSRNPKYVVITLAVAIHIASYNCILILLSPHVISLGYSKKDADLVVSLAGGCEIFAKIIFGLLIDKWMIKPMHIFVLCLFVSGILATVISFLHWYTALVMYGASVGIFAGSFMNLVTLLIIEAVGLKRFPQAVGMTYQVMAFAVIVGPPIAGWLKDITGTWIWSLRYAGSLSVFSSLLLLLEPRLSKWLCCHLQNNEIKDES